MKKQISFISMIAAFSGPAVAQDNPGKWDHISRPEGVIILDQTTGLMIDLNNPLPRDNDIALSEPPKPVTMIKIGDGQ